MASNEPLKPKINGTLYITILSDINMDARTGNDKKCCKETIDISRKTLKYTRVDETIRIHAEKSDDSAYEQSTLVRDTQSYTYPIDEEGELAALRDEFKTGIFSENRYLNPMIDREDCLHIKMTERMVPSEQLFHFDVDHPYLLLALWGRICRLSARLARNVFPVFVEHYTQKIKSKFRNECYYRDLIRAIANSKNVKDDLDTVCKRLDGNAVTNLNDALYPDGPDRGNCIVFDKNGVHDRPESGKEYNVLVLSPTGLFAFLEKYRDCFGDLDKLATLCDRYPGTQDLPENEETAFIVRFLQDVGSFASIYQLTDYQRISLQGKIFDPQGRPVLDLFYVLVTVSRIGPWAYNPLREVLEYICCFKEHSLISISDVIRRILDVQTHKKYYKVCGNLYCCLHDTAYVYNYKKEWIKRNYTEEIEDRLVGFDPSEPYDSGYRFGNGAVMNEIEEISENEAIERYGLDAVIKALDLF